MDGRPVRLTIRRALPLIAAVMLGLPLAACEPVRKPQLVIWAWERTEDLRFAPATAEVAVLSASIVLEGAQVRARGRQFPLYAAPGQVTTAVVHVEISQRRSLDWTPEREAEVAAAIVGFAQGAWVRRLQVDFEVRASERPVLLGVLRAVRARLRPEIPLSMTALASWCETETWLAEAPVDEVAPMLFRMGPGGAAIRAKLARGGDFRNPRCRSALAISTDAPLARIPAGRRVYLFNPRSWTADDFERVRREHGG